MANEDKTTKDTDKPDTKADKPISPETSVQTRHVLPDGKHYVATAATLHLKNAEGDPHAEIQPVLARGGKRRGHLRRSADQRHDDEPHEGLAHAKRHRSLLDGLDEYFTHERDQ